MLNMRLDQNYESQGVIRTKIAEIDQSEYGMLINMCTMQSLIGSYVPIN